jgi:hypothetical protein
MTYSSTLASSPNLLYNLHCQPASADFAPYHGLQPTSKHLPSGRFSPPSSITVNTEGSNPSDPESDGTHSTLRSLRGSPMAEEGRDGGEKDKGKGKAVSRNTSPSASSSQGDMADNEMDVLPSQTSEQTEAPPPTKKKRTRTLTTPHQAAVLHALLAQVYSKIPSLPFFQLNASIVSFSHHRNAGRSGSSHWAQCQESAGEHHRDAVLITVS